MIFVFIELILTQHSSHCYVNYMCTYSTYTHLHVYTHTYIFTNTLT